MPNLSYKHDFKICTLKVPFYNLLYRCSVSVSKALPLVVEEQATETSQFVDIFDKFFDIMNVRDFTSGARYQKRFLQPYRRSDDEQLKVMHNTICVEIFVGVSFLWSPLIHED